MNRFLAVHFRLCRHRVKITFTAPSLRLLPKDFMGVFRRKWVGPPPASRHHQVSSLPHWLLSSVSLCSPIRHPMWTYRRLFTSRPKRSLTGSSLLSLRRLLQMLLHLQNPKERNMPRSTGLERSQLPPF